MQAFRPTSFNSNAFVAIGFIYYRTSCLPMRDAFDPVYRLLYASLLFPPSSCPPPLVLCRKLIWTRQIRPHKSISHFPPDNRPNTRIEFEESETVLHNSSTFKSQARSANLPVVVLAISPKLMIILNDALSNLFCLSRTCQTPGTAQIQACHQTSRTS